MFLVTSVFPFSFPLTYFDNYDIFNNFNKLNNFNQFNNFDNNNINFVDFENKNTLLWLALFTVIKKP